MQVHHFITVRAYALIFFFFFQWHARVDTMVYVSLGGGVNSVGPFGVSVIREFAQYNLDSGGREMCS